MKCIFILILLFLLNIHFVFSKSQICYKHWITRDLTQGQKFTDSYQTSNCYKYVQEPMTKWLYDYQDYMQVSNIQTSYNTKYDMITKNIEFIDCHGHIVYEPYINCECQSFEKLVLEKQKELTPVIPQPTINKNTKIQKENFLVITPQIFNKQEEIKLVKHIPHTEDLLPYEEYVRTIPKGQSKHNLLLIESNHNNNNKDNIWVNILTFCSISFTGLGLIAIIGYLIYYIEKNRQKQSSLY